MRLPQKAAKRAYKPLACLVTGIAVIIGLALGVTPAVEVTTLDMPGDDTAALDTARLHANTAYAINLAPESLFILTEIDNSQELIDVAVWEMLGGGDQSLPLVSGNVTTNGQGATIAALEHLTGRKLELLAGKPSRLITEVALAHLGLESDNA